MIPIAIRITVFAAVVSQLITPPLPLRIGGMARQVSDKDYANLERTLPKGQKPWLFMGEPGQVPIVGLNVYLPATRQTSELRRGPGGLALLLKPPTWKLDSKDSCCNAWAQVAIEGRNFDEIHDESDMNRPFHVIGAFTDAELLSLVRTLRDSETIHLRLAAVTTTRELPILAIQRGPRNNPATIVAAYLRIDDSRNSTAEITLRQEAEGWQIVRVLWGSS